MESKWATSGYGEDEEEEDEEEEEEEEEDEEEEEGEDEQSQEQLGNEAAVEQTDAENIASRFYVPGYDEEEDGGEEEAEEANAEAAEEEENVEGGAYGASGEKEAQWEEHFKEKPAPAPPSAAQLPAVFASFAYAVPSMEEIMRRRFLVQEDAPVPAPAPAPAAKAAKKTSKTKKSKVPASLGLSILGAYGDSDEEDEEDEEGEEEERGGREEDGEENGAEALDMPVPADDEEEEDEEAYILRMEQERAMRGGDDDGEEEGGGEGEYDGLVEGEQEGYEAYNEEPAQHKVDEAVHVAAGPLAKPTKPKLAMPSSMIPASVRNKSKRAGAGTKSLPAAKIARTEARGSAPLADDMAAFFSEVNGV